MYEDAVQHKARHPVVGFGEQVMFKLAIDQTRRGTFDADHGVSIGVCLGWSARTTECFGIGKDGRVYNTRDIRRLTADKRMTPNA